MSAKAGSVSDLISIPKGGGALKGLGEKFGADLHTGTGNFSVPIAVPAGRSGFQPELSLTFSTGAGNGPLGLGWALSIPGVTRLSSKGIPRYRDDAPETQDTFVLSGAEDLVKTAAANGVDLYRPRTEGLFARIEHHRDNTDHWVVQTKDGLSSVYGTPGPVPEQVSQDSRAVVADPADRTKVFAWRLSETRDLFGNRILYDYIRDNDSERGRNGEQLYLRRICYVDLPEQGIDRYFVSVEFLYDNDLPAPGIAAEVAPATRPDAFSDYRAGFEIRTRRRCKWIVVRTHPVAGDGILVRAFELIYLDEQMPAGDQALPLNGVSMLSRINVVGYDDMGVGNRELPPLDFGYSRFNPRARRFTSLQGRGLPMTSLTNPDMELVDLFGSGLPDIVELGGTNVRYWRNLGGGKFDMPRSFVNVPASWRLSDTGVQLLDANGDGRADLLVTSGEMAGYYPMDFSGGFNPKSYQRYPQAPSFNLEDPEVRLIDLTGDGVTDVLRSGTSLECYFNDPLEGWSPTRTARIQRQDMDFSFSDPRVKFADLSGDGLQDMAVVYRGRVDYWSNLGYGRFGDRLTMQIPDGLPEQFDPQRVLLGDVDGDGLADLIYVSDREVTLWINRTGNGWSAPITIRGTPAVNDMVAVRLSDLMGTGVPGLLWSRDADAYGTPQHFFLDFTGGIKPYLLTRMDNNLGAITEVTYASSIQAYLRDAANVATRWRTTLPFPVQVVERVTVTDALSGGTLTTEYRYHHGYWDGQEREFRGFGMVEQLDTEVFSAYAGRGLPVKGDMLAWLLAQQSFSPPVLTRTWFHQGPVDPADGGAWQEFDGSPEYWPGDADPAQLHYLPDGGTTTLVTHKEGIDAFLRTLPRAAQRDALRSLRGSVLRSETYALDGSLLQERPYTVTEQAYALSEIEPPAQGSTRQRIFLPHQVAQRTTQWERGSEPMTQFTFTGDYDDVGQPHRQLAVACPRGWRTWSDVPPADFLCTLGLTTYAVPATNGPYLRDRVARTRSYEITQTKGQTIAALVPVAESDTRPKRLIGESLSYYDGLAFQGLPFGQLGAYGVVVRSESLVLTESILQTCYGSQRPPYLNPSAAFTGGGDYPSDFAQRVPALAGYTYYPGGAGSPQSGGWYTQAGRSSFDFQAPNPPAHISGLLLAQQDPLGNETHIAFEDYLFRLLPQKVTGPTGMVARAEYNLRLLQPSVVTDANGNRSEITYSPSGLVTATYVRGKAGRNEGDVTLPSVSMQYGLRAFHESRLVDPANPQPVFVRAIRRVFHDSDADDSGETIEAREYSDGFGRLLQTRTQGEAVRFGDARFGDGVLSPDQDTGSGGFIQGAANTNTDAPNVTVSGWQVYDNKGRVVEKYEPYFDSGWHYRSPLEEAKGQKVVMFYDAPGRVVRTLNPDGSEQRVIHGIPHDLAAPPLSPLDADKFTPTPWEAYSYDANDNAGRTHAGIEPHTNYTHHYNTPASAEIDSLGRTVRAVARHRAPPNADGSLPPIEVHVTRSSYDIQGNLTGIRDALGRLAFEYFYDLAKHPLRTESIDAGPKHVALNAVGNPIESRDAKGALRLHAYDALGRPTHLWARDAAEPLTLRESFLYGDDPSLTATAAERNQLGKLVQHHDEAGVVAVVDYDFKGNILGSSRQVLSDEFMLANVRQAQASGNWVLQAPRVDWANPPANIFSASPPYTTRSAYDALGRIKWSDYPQAANGDRYRLRPDYNRAGGLESVALVGPLDASDQGASQPFVRRIAYNAKGQRSLIAYGNGILTRYAYEPATFRLARLRTERYTASDTDPLHLQFQGAPLQDIAYWFDLAGNILGMLDVTPGSGVTNNPEAIFNDSPLREQLSAGDALIRCFEYDPLYRLTSATGREATNIGSPRPWTDEARNGYNSGKHGTANQDNAPNLTALYWEEYAYDPAGNMLNLRHSQNVQSGGSAGWQVQWSRRFGMEGRSPDQWRREAAEHLSGDWLNPPSNRLTHVEDRSSGGATPPSVPQSHFYDANGNMVGEHTERHFEWDHADGMKVFRNQVATSQPTIYALYLYDSGGQRVKKLVVKGNDFSTTTYLGAAFEHHAQQSLNGSSRQENCSLHVMDDKSRIAIVRVGPAFDDDGAKDHPVQYHLGDHLGSSVLVVSGEGGWINREEFFPYGETSFGSFGRKRYRFAGMERDLENGLTYHSLRYCNVHLGRWASPDPIGSAATLNLFQSFANAPLNHIDPTGTEDLPGGVNLGSEKATGAIPIASQDDASSTSGAFDQPSGGCPNTPSSKDRPAASNLDGGAGGFLVSGFENGAFTASLMTELDDRTIEDMSLNELEQAGQLTDAIRRAGGKRSDTPDTPSDSAVQFQNQWLSGMADVMEMLQLYVIVADVSASLTSEGGASNEATAGSRVARTFSAEISDDARLYYEAARIHTLLDAKAMKLRTTSVVRYLKSDGKIADVFASGRLQDLSPLQREALIEGAQFAAKLPGADAEMTALYFGSQNGWHPLLGNSFPRNICSACRLTIEEAGGVLENQRLFRFPNGW
jgi:RHS repeat-associated protein